MPKKLDYNFCYDFMDIQYLSRRHKNFLPNIVESLNSAYDAVKKGKESNIVFNITTASGLKYFFHVVNGKDIRFKYGLEWSNDTYEYHTFTRQSDAIEMVTRLKAMLEAGIDCIDNDNEFVDDEDFFLVRGRYRLGHYSGLA